MGDAAELERLQQPIDVLGCAYELGIFLETVA
jgi:hypothetical protein